MVYLLPDGPHPCVFYLDKEEGIPVCILKYFFYTALVDSPVINKPYDTHSLMLGKCEGRRRRGRQRTRWLDSVIEAAIMNFTQLREAVEDRRARRALVHGVTKSRTRLND